MSSVVLTAITEATVGSIASYRRNPGSYAVAAGVAFAKLSRAKLHPYPKTISNVYAAAAAVSTQLVPAKTVKHVHSFNVSSKKDVSFRTNVGARKRISVGYIYK
jgi:hypothetical protein